MGVSTDAHVAFGYKFEEDFEFPWKDEGDGLEDGLEQWWRKVNGFVNPHEDPFDDAGNYRTGFTDGSPEVKAYFDCRRTWDTQHPMPVELVNYCSCDYPAYILAVPSSVKTAHRGYPEQLDMSGLAAMLRAREVADLMQFVKAHNIEVDDGPHWWLCSYYG